MTPPFNYEDYEEDDLEEAIDNCGLDDNGDCLLAGTEHCSFFCPFHSTEEEPDKQPEH